MKYLIILNTAYFFLLSFLLFDISAQETEKPEFNADYPDALSFLLNLKSNGESAEIKSEIIFQRDVGTFKLFEGKIFLCPEYKGNQCALLFVGKGEFSFTPPTEVERKQLYRFYEAEEFKSDFKQLFLLFDDNTYEELTEGLNFQKTNPRMADDYIKLCIDYFKEYNYAESKPDFLRSIITEGRNGFFTHKYRKVNLTQYSFR